MSELRDILLNLPPAALADGRDRPLAAAGSVRAAKHRAERGVNEPVKLMPDFICSGCGHAVFQAKEPVHCTHCGGIAFTVCGGAGQAEAVSGEFDAMAGTLRRIARDAAAVAATLDKSGHRGRRKIRKELASIESLAMRSIRFMLGVPDAVRPTRKENDAV